MRYPNANDEDGKRIYSTKALLRVVYPEVVLLSVLISQATR